MDTKKVDNVLAMIHRYLDVMTDKTFEGEDLADELALRMNLAMKVREGFDLTGATRDEIRFAIAIVGTVYLSAMEVAGRCYQEGQDPDDPDLLRHQVHHVAAVIQDYVLAMFQLEEAEVEEVSR